VAYLSFIHLRLEGHHLLRAAGHAQRRFAAPKRIPQVKHNDKHLSATAVPLAKPITTGSALPDVYSAIMDGVEEMLGTSRGCVYWFDGFCLSKPIRCDVSSARGTDLPDAVNILLLNGEDRNDTRTTDPCHRATQKQVRRWLLRKALRKCDPGYCEACCHQ